MFKTESLHGMQFCCTWSVLVFKFKHRPTTVLEKILLDLHHHIARLSWLIQEYLFWLIQEYLFFSKKSNQDQHWKFSRGRTLCPITHLVLFIQIQTSSMTSFLNSHKFYLYQNVYIYICILCLKLKMVNNVIWRC